MTDFLYIKSQDVLVNVSSIGSIFFINNVDDKDQWELSIYNKNEDEIWNVTGKDAEDVYLELLKKLPNIIILGK